jgi:hypothetical protein
VAKPEEAPNMIEKEITNKLDCGALRSSIELRDLDALISFYSDDAELRILNAAFPDGPAFELRGRAQIEKYLRAVCDQQMICSVEGEVVFDEGSVEFVEACHYPNGTPISVRPTLEVAGGLIKRQTDVVERARRADESERSER